MRIHNLYTDASGQTIRPLGDIEDEGFALVGSLDATQQKAAILGSTGTPVRREAPSQIAVAISVSVTSGR